jgi:hypothetical protein
MHLKRAEDEVGASYDTMTAAKECVAAMQSNMSGMITAGERCAICERRRAERLLDIETLASPLGSDNVLETPLSAYAWTLCDHCAMAVQQEMARAGLRSPLRLPIAVAVVASERSRAAHLRIWSARYWKYADARTQDRWMMLIIFCLACPIIAFVEFVILPLLFQ